MALIDQLLSIDPGVRGCGIAIFLDGTLHRAFYLRLDDGVKETYAAAAQMAYTLHRAVYNTHDQLRTENLGRRSVCEFPRAYPTGRGRRTIDPNDLIALAAVAGAAAAMGAEFVFPRDWKGTIDGDAFLVRIRSALTSDETGRIESPSKSLEHNVLDAVGIGLWKLGRLQRHRVIERE